MRYSPSTLQFFGLGRKLFGGRFIRFMSGPKNESDILTGSSTPNKCGNPVWKDINILKLKEIFLINLVSWLMGILNWFIATCFCLFPWRWYRQSISKWIFVKSQCQSPFPLSLESWYLLKVDRVFISFMFKSVNLSILQKTINKTSKSSHALAMCSIRTDLLKQENEKIDSL